MCLYPRVINRSNRFSGLNCLGGIEYIPSPNSDFFVKHYKPSDLSGFHRFQAVVPCGNCSECLKKRQNDLAVRCVREASKRGSMCFLTLTYNDESLPYQIRLERVDKSSGEIFHDIPSSPLVRYKGLKQDSESIAYISDLRNSFRALKPGRSARVITRPFLETESDLYRYEITPSLNRRDVRLWLKRCRVRYSRAFGRPLPDFSYIVCGEYGPNTCRPHYHLIFFGLPYSDCAWCAQQWDFGFINLKRVNAVNEDGTNGFEIASKYIGKYVTKGKFECDSVTCGLSEKPRLMISRRVGVELDHLLISHYRAYDLFGDYDIDTLRLRASGKKLSKEQLCSLFDEIRKRSCVTIGEHSYALPRALIIKIWYKYHESTKSFRASSLRLLFGRSLQSDFLSDYIRKLKKNSSDLPEGSCSSSCAEFLAVSLSSAASQDAFNFRSFADFYSRSIF